MNINACKILSGYTLWSTYLDMVEIKILASYLTPFAKDLAIFSPFSHKRLN